MKSFTPLGRNILVEMREQKAEKNGIILPTSDNSALKLASVLACGPDLESNITENDVIALVPNVQTIPIVLDDGKELSLIAETHVVGKAEL